MRGKNKFLSAVVAVFLAMTLLLPGTVLADTASDSSDTSSAASETVTESKGDVSNAVVEGVQNMNYMKGNERQQDMDNISVILNGQKLSYQEDFTVSYEDNIEVTNSAKMIITGINGYTGMKTVTFKITKFQNTIEPNFGGKYWSDCSNISLYVGNSITLKVKDYGEVNGINIGTISAKVNSNLRIVPLGQSGDTTTFTITALKAGTGKVTITAAGDDMYNSVTSTYGITVKKNPKTQLKSSYVKLSKSSYTYTGAAKKPGVTVKVKGKKLKKNKDYTVKYSSNTSAGTAKVTIKGKGKKYYGTVTKTFKINKASQKISVKVSATSIKKGANAKITLNAKKGSTNAGTITYSTTNKKILEVYRNDSSGAALVIGNSVGTAKVKVYAAATKNYKAATQYITFNVTGVTKKLTTKMVTLNPTSFKYDGKNHYPVVTLKDGTKTLTYGIDYRYWITNEKGPGKANIEIWGVGNYSGTINVKYEIKK